MIHKVVLHRKQDTGLNKSVSLGPDATTISK